MKGNGDRRPTHAKLFMNGQSQAVRLPKEFRFEGTEVRIRRVGRAVILEPIDDQPWPPGYWENMPVLDEEWRRPDDLVPPPIEAELDRP